MRGGNLQDPVSEQSSTTHRAKRKHSPIVEQCRHNHMMKKKKKKQRLSQISDEPQNMTSSGDLKPTQCSYEKKRKRNRRKSTSVEGHRRWVYSSRDMSSYKDKVVVVSYNILGVENALNHSDLYIEVPPQYLDWERRKKLIRKEINHYDSDILCFQEVDRFDDLDNLLEKDGFKGVYTARTGEACDGCAVFWKDKQFTLLHQENIEFREFDLRDNVAQLCVIKMKQNQSNADGNTQRSLSSSTRSFLVGNIHVLFNPNRGDIKLGQVRIFLEKAYKLSQEWGSIPIILSGDLNSVPQSAMYQFLAASELDIRLHDRRKISGQVESPSKFRTFSSHNKNAGRWVMSISKPLMYRWTAEELRLATGTDGVTHLQHQLKLSSAYFGIPGSCTTRDNFGEPLATSYHSMFMGTVDYIWHTEELVPVRVLETLPINILRKTGGLPSEKWGSDHLALVCELAFRSI